MTMDLPTLAKQSGFQVLPGQPGSAAAAGLACRDTVYASFPGFSKMFEGYTTFMYTDAKGLVTTGVGNLCDPVGIAQGLPWQHTDGSAASSSDVQAAFSAVKAAYPGVQSLACAKLTTIRLTIPTIEKMVRGKMLENDRYFASNFSGFGSWPADAQLALHSMGWAMGPAFNFPQFKTACVAQEFTTAAANCHMKGIGIDLRNAANVLLFQNAATVKSQNLDASRLWFLDSPSGSGGSGGGGSAFGSGLALAAAITAALGLGLYAAHHAAASMRVPRAARA